MMNSEEIKKSKAFVDMFLEMFGGEGAPVDFQIMKFDKNNSDILKKIMLDDRFMRLEDTNTLKQALLKFQKESEVFLKVLYSEIEKLEG